MLVAPPPDNEADRLADLRSCGVLDTPPDPEFDDLTLLAARICGTPVALVSLVAEDRQWFKSAVGLAARQTPRDPAFCAHAILNPGGTFVVEDATADPRFADSPLVVGPPHVRFYAGVPLVSPRGHALGSLCVIDRVPRRLSPEQHEALRALGRQAAGLLERRRGARALRESESRFRIAAGCSSDLIYDLDVPAGRIEWFGDIDRALGYGPGEFPRTLAAWAGAIHPDDRLRIDVALDRSLRTGERFAVEYRVVRRDGSVGHWTDLGAAAREEGELPHGPVRRLVGAVTDVSEQRAAARALAVTDARLRRQNAALVDLARRRATAGGTDLRAALAAVTEAGAHTLEVERASVWLYDDARTRIRCADLYRRAPGDHADGLELLAVDYPAYFAAIDADRTVAADDARTDPRTCEFAAGYLELLGITSMLDAPVRAGGRTVGVLCYEHVGPARRWTADEQAFADSMTNLVAVALEADERRRTADRLREETLVSETLNQVGRTIAAELDLAAVAQAVADAVTGVTRARCGAMLYFVPDADGRPALRYAVSGLPAEAFAQFPAPRATGIFGPTIRGEGIVRLADVTADPRYGQNAPYKGMPAGHIPVRSYLAAPVVGREGQVLGALVLGHEQAGVFQERDERIVVGVAAQAAVAVDNARLFDAARRAAERMTYQALHDGLTGLPNRALFADRVGRCLERARRDPAYRFAVLFLDLDRFKVINDSLGHAAGDRLLVEVADRLRLAVRGTDTVTRLPHAGAAGGGADDAGPAVARLGGDEFTLLLDDLRDPTDAARVAERVLAAVARPVAVDGSEVTTTASIGIVACGGGGTDDGAGAYADARELLRDADTAMYKAKAAGKNRYAAFDATMHAAALARLRLESDLRRAIDRGELMLYYQPVVSLATRELVGFEGLARWRRDGALVSPGEFIPVAEDTGLIVPLGRWVLREGCRQLAAWRAAYPGRPPVTMSLNLSRRQLDDPDLVPYLARTMAETGVDPAAVKLEITESIIMEDGDAARRVLADLRATGVKLSMDDFGTGYSSLSCLHKFPLDELKVDRSFVQHLHGRRDAAAVVHAIVGLAHNLGMRVVAEGVEQPDQVAFLQALECDHGQGYLFAKPLPAAEAERFLAGGTTGAGSAAEAGSAVGAAA